MEYNLIPVLILVSPFIVAAVLMNFPITYQHKLQKLLWEYSTLIRTLGNRSADYHYYTYEIRTENYQIIYKMALDIFGRSYFVIYKTGIMVYSSGFDEFLNSNHHKVIYMDVKSILEGLEKEYVEVRMSINDKVK